MDDRDPRQDDKSCTIFGRLFLTWRDPRLATSPGGAVRIVRQDEMWTPPIGFANAQEFKATMPASCTIAPDGRVRLEAPFNATFNSPFDLRLFPFDRDSLRMVVHISDAYVELLDIRVDHSRTAIDRVLLFDAEWDVREVQGANYLAPESSDRADRLKFELNVVRRSSFYLWSFFLPMTLLVITTWSLFWTGSPNLQVNMNGLVAITAYRFAVVRAMVGGTSWQAARTADPLKSTYARRAIRSSAGHSNAAPVSGGLLRFFTILPRAGDNPRKVLHDRLLRWQETGSEEPRTSRTRRLTWPVAPEGRSPMLLLVVRSKIVIAAALALLLAGCGGGVAQGPAASGAELSSPGTSGSLAVTGVGATSPGATRQVAPSGPQLYLYLQTNLKDDTQLALAHQLLDRAAAAGYTAVVYNDYWANGTTFGPMYLARLQQFLAHATAAGLTVIPQTWSFGYSDTILNFGNPNLAEGQPVVGASFTVAADGRSLVFNSTLSGPPNGGFEAHTGDRFALWDYQDGGRLHADTTVAHGGQCSLRIDPGTGNARIMKMMSVKPWRQYHIQVYIRTQGFSVNPDQIDVRAYDPVTNQPRNHDDHNGPFRTQASQDWTRYDLVFNSAESTSINLCLGLWGASGGSVWFDDLQVDEIALVNLIRRSGAPLRVYDASATYTEGVDFSPVTDPLAFKNGRFDLYHQPPTVTLPAGSQLTPGKTVSMDYHAVMPVYNRPVGACLTDPGVQAYQSANLQQLDRTFPQGTGFLLNYDEMRHVNTCAGCVGRGLTAGQFLAWHVGQSTTLLRSVRPQAPLYIWGDMFDPNQNATNHYYLVGGDLQGSWNGLPRDVVVMNWNLPRLKASLDFFAGMGYSQVVTGYFDSGDGAASATREVTTSTGVPGVKGLMYTTWKGDFSQLESYATAARAAWAASLPH